VVAALVVGTVAAVVVVGVMPHLIVGAVPAGTVVIVGVVGVVAREVIGALRGGLRAAMVVVGVVARRIVNSVGGRRPDAAMMMGVVARRIIVPAPHHVDLGRVIQSMVRPMAHGADRGERHSPLHRFQVETPLNPSTVYFHDGISRVIWVIYPLLPRQGIAEDRPIVRHESARDRSCREDLQNRRRQDDLSRSFFQGLARLGRRDGRPPERPSSLTLPGTPRAQRVRSTPGLRDERDHKSLLVANAMTPVSSPVIREWSSGARTACRDEIRSDVMRPISSDFGLLAVLGHRSHSSL
jgi:hypothetical protein